jgi:DNA-binding IclR family transcriptional regulator
MKKTIKLPANYVAVLEAVADGKSPYRADLPKGTAVRSLNKLHERGLVLVSRASSVIINVELTSIGAEYVEALRAERAAQ